MSHHAREHAALLLQSCSLFTLCHDESLSHDNPSSGGHVNPRVGRSYQPLEPVPTWPADTTVDLNSVSCWLVSVLHSVSLELLKGLLTLHCELSMGCQDVRLDSCHHADDKTGSPLSTASHLAASNYWATKSALMKADLFLPANGFTIIPTKTTATAPTWGVCQ